MGSVSVSPPPLAEETDLIEVFKAAMRRFAVSVSIITIADAKTRAGMTATAVSSVSLDPPSLLVCVNRKARFHVDMHRGRRFCVNMLSDDQSALSSAFGGRLPADERFKLGTWLVQGIDPPYLSEAQANVFCTVDALFDYGSHTIFIGKVESVRLSGKCRPLVFADGRYFSIVAGADSIEAPPSDIDWTWL